MRRAIADLLADPLRGYALHADLSGFRSYRVKGYRVLYQFNDRDAVVEVHYVGRRRDVYESFQALLAKNDQNDQDQLVLKLRLANSEVQRVAGPSGWGYTGVIDLS